MQLGFQRMDLPGQEFQEEENPGIQPPDIRTMKSAFNPHCVRKLHPIEKRAWYFAEGVLYNSQAGFLEAASSFHPSGSPWRAFGRVEAGKEPVHCTHVCLG